MTIIILENYEETKVSCIKFIVLNKTYINWILKITLNNYENFEKIKKKYNYKEFVTIPINCKFMKIHKTFYFK